MSSGSRYTSLGLISRTHGLKGTVVLQVTGVRDVRVLEGLSAWTVPPSPDLGQTKIVRAKLTPKGVLVDLEGCRHLSLAAPLKGCELLVQTEDLPGAWLEPEDHENEMGFSVRDRMHGDLGVIDEIIETGANDVWVVHGPLGEVLIPVIDSVVESVDSDSRLIEVTLLDGLLPEEHDA